MSTEHIEPIWRPSDARIAETAMRRFIDGQRWRLDGDDYAALHRWSVRQPEEFWPAAADLAGIRFAERPARVLVDGEPMPGARWFDGATLSFADNLLRPEHDGIALIAADETGRRRVLDRTALREQVAALSAAFDARGVGPGDRVAALLPNTAETIVAMLAAAAVGATFSSCSPDFGAGGVLERFGQIEPKVLIGADGYYYGGKRIDALGKLADVAARVSSIESLIVVGFCDARPTLPALARPGKTGADGPGADTRSKPYVEHWEDVLAAYAGAPFSPRPMPFSHPLYILYSSGTTGAPKCIVHGAGGTLLQHQKEHVLHCDIRPGDVVFYFTTCGWMMWHWLASALAAGATLLLYDGSPLHPDPNALWRLAARESAAVFGTSAKYLHTLEKSGAMPRDAADFPALRAVLSTGSPLPPSSFDYVYRAIKDDVQLASISGGTDIVSCFALGNPIGPVYRGELQCKGLGMDVQVFDESGHPVHGRKGELVCASPFPSMPVGFWNDPDGRRYRAAYFERFPGVWCHGDYAEITRRDGMIIHGRSDAVLNPGGVRIGTAEIYRIVEQIDGIAECVAVDQRIDGDTRVLLFVRMSPGQRLDEPLEAQIRVRLRRDASPRHVPAKILEVTDIPRTLNGKISELAVRDAIHGNEVGNLDALANPGALDAFRDRPELRS